MEAELDASRAEVTQLRDEKDIAELAKQEQMLVTQSSSAGAKEDKESLQKAKEEAEHWEHLSEQAEIQAQRLRTELEATQTKL